MNNIELNSQEYFSNPAKPLEEIRKADPVLFHTTLKKWIITNYEDVQALANHPSLTSNYHREAFEKLPKFFQWWFSPLVSTLSHAILYSEPPDHTRLRRMGNVAFSPATISALTDKIRKSSLSLLNEIDSKKESEIISNYAFTLPIIVICEILGVPFEDRKFFRQCSDEISDLVVKSNPSFLNKVKANRSIGRLRRYFLERLKKGQVENLTATFANILANGDMSQEEYLSFCILLLIAGHETTKNMIGNSIWILSQHPAELKKLRQNPNLLDNAIDECLRYESAVPVIKRRVKETFQFKDKVFKKGDEVLFALAASNRDPKVFTNPNLFDIARTNNNHLSFGFGRHFCLGSTLTKIELKIALQHLLDKFPNLTIARPPRWRQTLSHHGPETLWVINKNN